MQQRQVQEQVVQLLVHLLTDYVMAFLPTFPDVLCDIMHCPRCASCGFEPKYTGSWRIQLSPNTGGSLPEIQWGCWETQYPSNPGHSSNSECLPSIIYDPNIYHLTHPLGDPQYCLWTMSRRPHKPRRHSHILHLRMAEETRVFSIPQEESCGIPCTHACKKTSQKGKTVLTMTVKNRHSTKDARMSAPGKKRSEIYIKV